MKHAALAIAASVATIYAGIVTQSDVQPLGSLLGGVALGFTAASIIWCCVFLD